MYKIQIVKTIRGIDKESWEALVDENACTSYGWLRTVEEWHLEGVQARYVLVKYAEQLVGAAVCYIIRRSDQVLDFDSMMFGKYKKYFRKTGISFSPLLICCPMKSYGSHFLTLKDLDKQEKKVANLQLLRAIEDMARSSKLAVAFTNLLSHEDEVISLLNKKGYHKTFALPLTYLDVKWPSFEAYTHDKKLISKNMRSDIVRQINRNKKEGVTIRKLKKLDGDQERFYELINDNYEKYNQLSCPFRKDFLWRLKQNMQDDAIIYVASKEGKKVGVCVVLKRGKVRHSLVIGVDHKTAGNDFTYFNLGYYYPIEDAIQEQAQRLYFGNAQYDVKRRRGCKIENTYIFYKSFSPIKNTVLKPWFLFHSLWYQKKFSRITGKCE